MHEIIKFIWTILCFVMFYDFFFRQTNSKSRKSSHIDKWMKVAFSKTKKLYRLQCICSNNVLFSTTTTKKNRGKNDFEPICYLHSMIKIKNMIWCDGILHILLYPIDFYWFRLLRHLFGMLLSLSLIPLIWPQCWLYADEFFSVFLQHQQQQREQE